MGDLISVPYAVDVCQGLRFLIGSPFGFGENDGVQITGGAWS